MTTTTQHSRLAPALRGGRRTAAQTRLPWWALALPAPAFVALLTLLTSGPAAADGSGGGTGADVLGRLAMLLGTLMHHML